MRPFRDHHNPRTVSHDRLLGPLRSLVRPLRSGTLHWNAPTYPLHHVKQHRGNARTWEALQPAPSRATPTRVASDIVASFDPLDPPQGNQGGSKSPVLRRSRPSHFGEVVEADGIEPTTPCLQSRCSPTELRPRTHREVPRRPNPEKVVGPGRFELPTSRLSSARSNQLSYEPECSSVFADREGRDAPAAAGSRSRDRGLSSPGVSPADLIVSARKAGCPSGVAPVGRSQGTAILKA